MKLFRKAAVAAALIAGALAFAPTAAQAHSGSGTYTPRVANCSLGSQHFAGTQVGLVNLGNLNLSALDNTAIGALGGLVSASSRRSINCIAN